MSGSGKDFILNDEERGLSLRISVSIEDLTFEPTALNNLFNINDADVTLGKFVNQINGELLPSVSYNASGWIPVEPDTQYYFHNVQRYAEYDESKVYVPGTGASRAASALSLLTSPTTNWVRFSTNTDSRWLWNRVYLSSDTGLPFYPFDEGSWVTPTKVLYMGDSYWNNTTDISNETITLSGIAGNYAASSVPSSRLDQIPADLVASGYDLSTFDTVVIGRGLNDVSQGATLQQLKDRLLDAWQRFAGKQIIVANLPPVNELPGYDAAMQTIADDFNEWLRTFWPSESSHQIFDLNSVLDTDGDLAIDPAYYQGGDPVHPNPAGMTAAATVLASMIA